MKILILSDDFPPASFGGAGIIAQSQAVELAKRGYDILVVTAVHDIQKAGRTSADGLTICALYDDQNTSRRYRALYNPKLIKGVETALREFHPDVVHAHNLHQSLSFYSLVVARKYASKVFLTAHDAMAVHYSKIYPRVTVENGQRRFDYRISGWHQLRYFWRQGLPFRNAWIRMCLRSASKILAVSQALEDALEENGVGNCAVMHNGIDIKDNTLSGDLDASVVSKYGLAGKEVLLFGGRLGTAKGGDMAYSLIKQLHVEHPNIRLVIAGSENAYSRTLLRRSEKDGVGDFIVMTGWVDRAGMSVLYQAADIILTLSTYMDPFPTINLEAMAARRPVVGTCFGGTPEAVENGVTGYIVDPRNPIQVYDRVAELLANREKRITFGNAGRVRAEKYFNISGVVDRLEQLYAAK